MIGKTGSARVTDQHESVNGVFEQVVVFYQDLLKIFGTFLCIKFFRLSCKLTYS